MLLDLEEIKNLVGDFFNGQYDVKDFLKLMEKKEVEKKTGIKKFDICLMNPPYIGKNVTESTIQGILANVNDDAYWYSLTPLQKLV